MDEPLEIWFQREILPHEAALVRYLQNKAPALKLDARDLRHEVYIRVIEAAETVRPSGARPFLFSIARNLLIDLARRGRVVSIDFLEDLDLPNVLIDEISPERVASGRQQLQRLSLFFLRLPAKCREILWMRRIEGMPQRQVAERLGMTEGAVEKQVHRGLRYLADAVYGGSPDKETARDREAIERETGHGD